MAKGHLPHNAPPDKRMRKMRKLILFSSFLTAIGGYSERSANVYAPRSRAAERAIMSHLYGPFIYISRGSNVRCVRRVLISSHVTVTADGVSVSAG